MRLRTFAAALVTAFSFSAAHADTLTTYTVENQAGTSSLGSLTLDETLGTITNLTLTSNPGGTFSGAPLTYAFDIYLDEYVSTFSDAGFGLQFEIPGSTLVGYAPAANSGCATASYLCDYLANVYAGSVPTGGITPAPGPISTFEGNLVATTANSVTPEPSTFALLGTGLLSVAGLARRRRAKL